MAGFAEKMRRLKDFLFGKEKYPSNNAVDIIKSPSDQRSTETEHKAFRSSLEQTEKPTSTTKTDKSIFEVGRQKDEPSNERDPYFFQIGFDFGTAFSKCICRDVNTSEAWVYVSPRFSGNKMECLYPSLLKYENKTLSYIDEYDRHYADGNLYHLKWALREVASSQWDAQTLNVYRQALERQDNRKLAQFVEVCSIYYLAGVLGEIRADLITRFNDYGNHPNDLIAVNLGIPVAFAEEPKVRDLYHGVLCKAWWLSNKLSGHPYIKYDELKNLCDHNNSQPDSAIQDVCFLVPEVSANLQGFVKSRVSKPGIYLFSDTGAATVDQCIFTFTRRNFEEGLNYLHADVIPLGSSQIEFIAASMKTDDCNAKCSLLEKWRKLKEKGADEYELKSACSQIAEKLSSQTLKILASSRRKLYNHNQLEDVDIIFGGGGHCDNPYKEAVLYPFSYPTIFNKPINPNIIGIPKPTDLTLNNQQEAWLPRLSVAYGLSFNRFDLADNLFPHQIDNPKEEEIWQPIATRHSAPTKDEC